VTRWVLAVRALGLLNPVPAAIQETVTWYQNRNGTTNGGQKRLRA
jgi:hypothetical protein